MRRRRRATPRQPVYQWSDADLEAVRADFDRKRAALRQLQIEIVAEIETRMMALSRGPGPAAVRVTLEPADAAAEALRDG